MQRSTHFPSRSPTRACAALLTRTAPPPPPLPLLSRTLSRRNYRCGNHRSGADYQDHPQVRDFTRSCAGKSACLGAEYHRMLSLYSFTGKHAAVNAINRPLDRLCVHACLRLRLLTKHRDSRKCGGYCACCPICVRLYARYWPRVIHSNE